MTMMTIDDVIKSVPKRPTTSILERMVKALTSGALEANPQSRQPTVNQLRMEADRLQKLAVAVLNASKAIEAATTVHQRAKATEDAAAILNDVLGNLR
jgi:hypothetical protein